MHKHAHTWPLTLCLLSIPERGRLPSGSVLGGRSPGGLLVHGPAVVRGCHRYLYRSHRQSEDGNWNIGSWRAAEVPGSEVRLLQYVCKLYTEHFINRSCFTFSSLPGSICDWQTITRMAAKMIYRIQKSCLGILKCFEAVLIHEHMVN